jgi:anti-sigma regulatory factor (Ser/Thr protein kinase)
VTSADSDLRAEAEFDERFDAASLHLLRDQVAVCAAGAGMPEDRAAEVTLAIHELAANVVTHGPGSGRLRLRAAAHSLRCRVSDAGVSPGPWPVQPGHGLWIVQKIADLVTTSFGPHGSAVTAVFGWQAEHD